MACSWLCARSKRPLRSRAPGKPCAKPLTGQSHHSLTAQSIRGIRKGVTDRKLYSCRHMHRFLDAWHSWQRTKDCVKLHMVEYHNFLLQADSGSHRPLREDAAGAAEGSKEPECDASTANSSRSSGGAPFSPPGSGFHVAPGIREPAHLWCKVHLGLRTLALVRCPVSMSARRFLRTFPAHRADSPACRLHQPASNWLREQVRQPELAEGRNCSLLCGH